MMITHSRRVDACGINGRLNRVISCEQIYTHKHTLFVPVACRCKLWLPEHGIGHLELDQMPVGHVE